MLQEPPKIIHFLLHSNGVAGVAAGVVNLTGQEREALWAELGLKKKSKLLSVAERGEE